MKKALRSYFYVIFGTGLGRMIGLVNSIIIARELGPAEFGLFSVFYVVMILTSQLPHAFDITFVRYAKTCNRSSEKSDFLKTAVFLKLVYSAIILSASYPLAFFLSTYCFRKTEVSTILVVSMICGMFLSFLMTVASTFQEKEKFAEFAVLNVFYTAPILCALLLLKSSNFEFSLNNVISIYLTMAIVAGAVSAGVLLRKVGKPVPLNLETLKTSFSLGKWIFGVTCAYYLFQRLDTLFLTRYANFESVGIYFVARRLVIIVALMISSLAGVSLPKASAALRCISSLKTYMKESILVIAMVNLFIVALMTAAPLCIKILYGKEYLPASPILRLLLIGWFFTAAYVPFSFLFYALEDSRTRFLLECSKVTIAILLLLWLVPKYSLVGGAIATSVALILNTLVSLAVLRYKLVKKYGGLEIC